MIEVRIANAVLQEALNHGADFSELYLEDTESNRIAMVDGRVENAAYTRLRGAGVRVLLGKRFVHTHVDGNKELERKGIHCAQSQDAVICRPRRTAVQEKHRD